MAYEVIMARWKGLEPPTFWFVAKHSIQLSYQRVCCYTGNLTLKASFPRKYGLLP